MRRALAVVYNLQLILVIEIDFDITQDEEEYFKSNTYTYIS